MHDEVNACKQKWLASQSWEDEQEYLKARIRYGEAPCVDLDPVGNWGEWLAVVVRRPTGVVYRNQCGGVVCDQRLAEGFLVVIGLWQPKQVRGANVIGDAYKTHPLIWVFHEGEGCCGWTGYKLPPQRLKWLRRLVRLVPYHGCEPPDSRFVVTPDPLRDPRLEASQPQEFCLDEGRIAEIAEAWIPVRTPDGPGVLLYCNCD
jgi:hypothetical protein